MDNLVGNLFVRSRMPLNKGIQTNWSKIDQYLFFQLNQYFTILLLSDLQAVATKLATKRCHDLGVNNLF